MTLPRTIPVGLIGAGRIGTSHAEIIAHRVPGASLVAVADPRPGVADALGSSLGARGVLAPGDIFDVVRCAHRACHRGRTGRQGRLLREADGVDPL